MSRRATAALGILAALAACDRSRDTPTIKPVATADEIAPRHLREPQSPRIANYRIEVRFDAESMALDATQRLTWRNAGASAVDALPFHLYMNAFKDENTTFMRESLGKHRRAKADWDNAGWIDVTKISIDGAADSRDSARFTADDHTVLEVPLAAPLPPGESVTVDMEFHVQLPEVFARTGFKGEFAMVGQWFPKVGVRVGARGAETWHCEPFHAASEFFADFGTYDVTITAPETYVIAASGVLTAAIDNADTTHTHSYRAEDVVDFAWMADPYMEVLTGPAQTSVGPVEVRVYYRPEQRSFAERHLRAGIGAIEVYSELFVPYPWTRMSIIDPPPDAAGGAGGMEYPTLVTTAADSAFTPAGVRFPEMVTVHEVGHNWFQGILASNEVDEAWLDEGVNEYTNGIVMQRIYGSWNVIDRNDLTADYYDAPRAVTPWPATPIATRSYEFPNFTWYGSATYRKTCLALRTLENIVGSERFLAAFKAYAQRYAFRHPTGRDLFATLEEQLGEDIDWFVQPAFYGGGEVDLRVEDIDCHGDICDVLIANRGKVSVPVDVDVWFEDGQGARVSWDGSGGWKEFRFERGDVARVVVDPDGKILLDRSPLLSDKRRFPDRAPARRAAARAQFWTQTLMGATGL